LRGREVVDRQLERRSPDFIHGEHHVAKIAWRALGEESHLQLGGSCGLRVKERRTDAGKE
jgi:hypothetical protein